MRVRVRVDLIPDLNGKVITFYLGEDDVVFQLMRQVDDRGKYVSDEPHELVGADGAAFPYGVTTCAVFPSRIRLRVSNEVSAHLNDSGEYEFEIEGGVDDELRDSLLGMMKGN